MIKMTICTLVLFNFAFFAIFSQATQSEIARDDTFVEDNWVVSMVWGEKNSVVEALLLQRRLQEVASAQCRLLPQGFCCAFPMTGIREIWGPDNRLYGFIIQQNFVGDWVNVKMVDKNAMQLTRQRAPNGGNPEQSICYFFRG